MTTDTALVAEEIVAAAALAYRQTYRVADATGVFPTHEDCIAAALAAVAPLIAARGASHHWDKHIPATEAAIRAAERERCARIAEMWESPGLAAAIRGGDDAAP